MILAIDAVGAKHSGAASVLRATVHAALRSPGIDRLVVLSSPREVRNFDFPADPRLLELPQPQAEGGDVARAH